MKLSFIVPVYNTGRYLNRCILSLLNQDVSNLEYEIIIVNDGSTDNSLDICNNLARSNHNIRVFSKHNGGLSSARNFGLIQAKGDYIWFVDSDDEIKKMCLKSLLEYAYMNDLDFVDFSILNVKDNIYSLLANVDCKPFTNLIISPLEYISQYKYGYSAWCNISKRKIWINNNISFIRGIIHEDYDCILRLLEKTKNIGYYSLNQGLYFYYVSNPTSITNSIKSVIQYKKSIESFLTILSNITNDKCFTDIEYSKLVAKYWIPFIKSLLLLEVIKSPLDTNSKLDYYKIFKDKNIFIKTKESLVKINSFKFRIFANLFFRNPFLYKLVLKLK